MCGIAGVFGKYDERATDRMVGAQAHRGPDDRGIWGDPGIPVSLGHNRLSIIDTSSSGHQPMSYAGGKLWITYNGEIYNYRELRGELEKSGYEFRSNSDTEVILAAYHRWGTECVERFRGMFAFALVDREPEDGAPEMILARDRLGIKPLLYCEDSSALWFASELKGLLASGRVERTIDPDSLLDYLAVGSVFQPRTIINGVKSLPPGHWMEVSKTGRKTVKYWDLHRNTETLRRELGGVDFEDAHRRLSVLLQEAARYSMVSDVPVGAFLSGGIDSTSVVGYMRDAGGEKIRTFAVGFEDTHRNMDERVFSRIASRHLGCDHDEVVVRGDEIPGIFQSIVRDIDQPSIDGTNTWIVSRAAGQAVKVAVSGLGGDELFAGYPHFKWLAEDAEKLPNGCTPARSAVELLHRIRPNHRSLRLLFTLAKPAERLAMLRRITANHEFRASILPKWRDGFENRLSSRYEEIQPDADEVQRTSLAEINGYLLSTLLRDSDVMSMAHGLEIRPMLLDHPLVEFAYALPAIHKLNGSNKKVLVRAAREYLPHRVRNREKMGFELPFAGWMAGPLATYFESLINKDEAKGIFTPAHLRRLSGRLRRKAPPRALWAWGILIAWMEENRIELQR